MIYLVEELGDARLRCDQLLRYLSEAVQLIEKSSHKDHFFEVAGHLIQSIPDVAFRLQKALQAVALAADRLDYEEIKQELRPEKVEELERVLKDVRIRPVQHRSFPPAPGGVGAIPMTPKQAAARLREIAKTAREEGSIPLHELTAFIHELEPKRQAADVSSSVGMLDKLAEHLEQNETPIRRTQLATVLSRIGMEAEFNSQLKTASESSSKTAFNGDSVLIESFELIRAQAILGSRAASANRWRTALMSLFNIVDAIGTILVQLGSMDTQKSEALKREIRQVLPQAPRLVEEAQPAVVMAFNEELVPIDAETVTESLDRILTSARMALVAAGQENWKKVLYHTVGALDGVGVVGTSFSIDGIGLMTRVRKSFIQKSGARPMLNLAGDASEEAKRSRFEEGKPADPTENMDPEDAKSWKIHHEENKDNFKEAKRDTHLEGKSGKTLCGERSYPDTTVDSVRDATCHYCKQSWQKSHGGITAGEGKRTKFEEGKPADPTKNMSPEDAKAWKVHHEENKDNFKSASAWKVVA
jgi:hypothetical protein